MISRGKVCLFNVNLIYALTPSLKFIITRRLPRIPFLAISVLKPKLTPLNDWVEFSFTKFTLIKLTSELMVLKEAG